MKTYEKVFSFKYFDLTYFFCWSDFGIVFKIYKIDNRFTKHKLGIDIQIAWLDFWIEV